MSIQTISDLNLALDEELSWRKRELTTLKFAVDSGRGHQKDPFIRATLCLLYAHWEGFVRAAARAYLEYVSRRRLRYSEMRPNFLTLGIRPHLSQAIQSRRITTHRQFTDTMLEMLEDRSRTNLQDEIDTASNLNYEVLTDILAALDVSADRYASKKVLIDEKLLKRRNTVAHGDFLDLEPDEYSDIHAAIIALFEQLRTDIENHAVNQAYRKSATL